MGLCQGSARGVWGRSDEARAGPRLRPRPTRRVHVGVGLRVQASRSLPVDAGRHETDRDRSSARGGGTRSDRSRICARIRAAKLTRDRVSGPLPPSPSLAERSRPGRTPANRSTRRVCARSSPRPRLPRRLASAGSRAAQPHVSPPPQLDDETSEPVGRRSGPSTGAGVRGGFASGRRGVVDRLRRLRVGSVGVEHRSPRLRVGSTGGRGLFAEASRRVERGSTTEAESRKRRGGRIGVALDDSGPTVVLTPSAQPRPVPECSRSREPEGFAYRPVTGALEPEPPPTSVPPAVASESDETPTRSTSAAEVQALLSVAMNRADVRASYDPPPSVLAWIHGSQNSRTEYEWGEGSTWPADLRKARRRPRIADGRVVVELRRPATEVEIDVVPEAPLDDLARCVVAGALGVCGSLLEPLSQRGIDGVTVDHAGIAAGLWFGHTMKERQAIEIVERSGAAVAVRLVQNSGVVEMPHPARVGGVALGRDWRVSTPSGYE